MINDDVFFKFFYTLNFVSYNRLIKKTKLNHFLDAFKIKITAPVT